MAVTISVPRINNDDDRVQIIAWHVEPGAEVQAGDAVVDLETAKTLVTLDAESAGFVRPLAEQGAVIKAGDPLYLYSPDLEALDKAAAEVKKPGPSKLSAPAHVLPPAARSEPASLAKEAEINALAQGEVGNINVLQSMTFNSAGIRKRLQNDPAFGGGIQPIILYEIAQLAKSYPDFTAYFADNRIYFYDRVDLGVAFDLGKGLKVVTIKGADKLKPFDFAEKTLDFGMRYLRNDIRQEELTNSTITITDVSGLNILYFHPLINGHQSIIIGIGGDAMQPGHPMSINLTFDHRVVNGRDAGNFLGELRTRILSYAPAEEAQPQETQQPSFYPAGPIRCDRCAIDLSTYYSKFKRDAYMMPYFREDGSMGSVCHRCAAGWA